MNGEVPLLYFFSLFLCSAVAQESTYLRRNVIPKKDERPDIVVNKLGASQGDVDKKECQEGFVLLGQQCVRNVIVPPTYTCDIGKTLIGRNCTDLVNKIPQCPPSYGMATGMCFKQKTTHSEVLCPDAFQLLNGDICSRKVKLPDVKVCPSGTRDNGILCMEQVSYKPQYVCPQQYTLQENKCILEQTYDCTPSSVTPLEISEETTASKTAPQLSLRSNRENGNGFVSDRPLRHELVTNGKMEIHRYTVFEEPPVVEEFLVKRICKRTVTEMARTLCDDGGQFDGRMCFVERPVPHITRLGGHKDETIPVIRQCPPTYTLDRNYGGMRCTSLDEVPPTYICPSGYEDTGPKCTRLSSAKRECPAGFRLAAGEHCQQTLIQQPIIHYSVRYTCRGKNCDAHVA